MSGRVKVIIAAVALAIVGWLGSAPVRAMYLERRGAVQKRIERLTAEIDLCRSGVRDHVRVTRALRGYAARTLGGDLQTVDHALRSRLSRIGEAIEMEALTVGTGRARRYESPAKNQFRLRGQRALREETDYVEVEGWISGEGSFEQVLRLVHNVRAEPWLKRISQVRLHPRDQGQRYEVSIRLSTIYLPHHAPSEPVGEPPDLSGFEEYAPLVARDPFRLATPSPPVVAAAPAPRPAYSYQQWVLTGVASGPQGPEVWLLNRESGQSRHLAVGETLRELRLVSASGEVAEFRFKDQAFRVVVGQRLTPPDK